MEYKLPLAALLYLSVGRIHPSQAQEHFGTELPLFPLVDRATCLRFPGQMACISDLALFVEQYDADGSVSAPERILPEMRFHKKPVWKNLLRN